MGLKKAHENALKKYVSAKKEHNFKAILGSLDALGRPQDSLKFIHIAGTNGKGSVCQILAESLRAAGFKTGLFTSPHLISPTERIKINGRKITAKNLEKLLNRVARAEKKAKKELNYFEILTAAALVYFKENKCDYVLWETGLGGLHDATNIVRPKVSVITSVSMDHMDVLGGTLEKIAAQKAGIIKKNVPCVAGEIPARAARVISKTAAKNNAPLYFEKDYFKTYKFLWEENTTLLKTARGDIWPLGILGEKQYVNASVAHKVLSLLNVPEPAIKKGFLRAALPARFEVKTRSGQNFIFDGGHNEEAIKSFTHLYKKAPFKNNSVLVFAAMKNKAYKTILKLLAKHFKNIIVWQAENDNCAPSADLAKITKALQINNYAALKTEIKKHKNIFFSGTFYQYKFFARSARPPSAANKCRYKMNAVAVLH